MGRRARSRSFSATLAAGASDPSLDAKNVRDRKACSLTRAKSCNKLLEIENNPRNSYARRKSWQMQPGCKSDPTKRINPVPQLGDITNIPRGDCSEPLRRRFAELKTRPRSSSSGARRPVNRAISFHSLPSVEKSNISFSSSVIRKTENCFGNLEESTVVSSPVLTTSKRLTKSASQLFTSTSLASLPRNHTFPALETESLRSRTRPARAHTHTDLTFSSNSFFLHKSPVKNTSARTNEVNLSKSLFSLPTLSCQEELQNNDTSPDRNQSGFPSPTVERNLAKSFSAVSLIDDEDDSCEGMEFECFEADLDF